MTGLYGLWLLSLVLAGLALLIMAGLIVARWIDQRRRHVMEAERKRLVPLLLAAPRSDERFDDVPPASNLLTDVSTELIQLVRGPDKETFVSSAGRLGVPQRLRARLRRGSARKRVAAAEALADFPDPASRSALAAALDDRHADVRLAAAVALAAMDDPPPAALLVRKLHAGTEESSMLITGLFEQIGRTRPDEIRALIEAEDTSPPVKAAAIESLAASGDYRLVPIVVRLAREAAPGSDELPRYLRALGQFGHPSGEPTVLQHLETDLWWVRAAAAEAAGRIGMQIAAPQLARMLDDADWWVRFRAGEALARLGETGHRLLSSTACRGSERARQAASLTLAERGLPA